MLEAGCVSARSTQNILIKNLLDTSIGAMVWWAAGHAIAYAGSNPFIGTANEGMDAFFVANQEQADLAPGDGTSAHWWAAWFFQFTYASVAATIVSGAVAERAELAAYLVYSSIITLLIYPVVVHWVWSPVGWLNMTNSAAVSGGTIDLAGSGVVHLTGGVAALCGAIVIGPRRGRFVMRPPAEDDGAGTSAPHSNPPQAVTLSRSKPWLRSCCSRLRQVVSCSHGKDIVMPMPGHSIVLQALGTFILWMGWFGFNAGSTLSISGRTPSTVAARIFVTTTLSGATGGFASVLLGRFLSKGRTWDVTTMCNGILTGLVSITAGCATVPVWASVLIGTLSALVYRAASYFVLHVLQVDDPLDAFAVHGAGGLWGVLAAALFSTERYVQALVGDANAEGGVLLGGAPKRLGAAVLLIVCNVCWTALTSTALFLFLRVNNILSKNLLDESSHNPTTHLRDLKGGSIGFGFVGDAKPTSKTSKVDRGAVSYSGAPKAKESTVYDGAESAL